MNRPFAIRGPHRAPKVTLGIVAATLWAAPAHADAGVPMLILVWPASWAAFIPIVFVEALIACRLLRLPFLQGARLSLVANAWSTLAGIPLTWLALLAVEFVVGGAFVLLKATPGKIATRLLSPFMAPWVEGFAVWEIPAAAAFLCLPFMLVSVWIEERVARRSVARELAKRWARTANLLTYVPMIVGLAILAIYKYLRIR